MRVAVLANPNSWYLQDIRRAAADQHEIMPVSFSTLAANLGPDGLQVASGTGTAKPTVHEMDAMLVRTMPPGSLEQVVFRMDILAGLESAGRVVVNSAKAMEAAVDKFLSLLRLAEAGLTVPRTFACQTSDEALTAFESLGRDVVIKPLFGSEGRGITRVSDDDLAYRAFRMLESMGAVIYVQEFIPHAGSDWRVLTIGDRMFGMKRYNSSDWRTNVSRGASAEPLEIDDRLAQIARTAASAVGATIAGVDVLPGTDGRWYVLEVNAVPGWKRLSQVLSVDVAQLVLQHVRELIEHR